jgi:hypothetical protein
LSAIAAQPRRRKRRRRGGAPPTHALSLAASRSLRSRGSVAALPRRGSSKAPRSNSASAKASSS